MTAMIDVDLMRSVVISSSRGHRALVLVVEGCLPAGDVVAGCFAVLWVLGSAAVNAVQLVCCVPKSKFNYYY